MKQVCISKGWTLSVNMRELLSEHDRVEKHTVDLPNDFCISMPRRASADGCGQNGFFQGGDATYVKYLTFPEGTEHCLLNVDGAYMLTDVRFNEELLAQHVHGYTPFLTDLTEHIRHGGATNCIQIRTVCPQPSTRWYSGGGLYRDVYLWYGGRVRVEPWDLFITTVMADESYAEISARFLITADLPTEARLRVRVVDGDGATVTTAEAAARVSPDGKTPVDMHLFFPKPRLWSDESPQLYRLEAEVLDGEQLTDTVSEEFGVRTLSFTAERGLLVNGKSVKLRGGCIHHTHAALGAADFPAAVERQLKALKAAGFNALRSAHNPPSLNLLKLCDRLGIYLMDEAFDMWREGKSALDYHLFFETHWRDDISAMVLRDRNHPSVITYSIGNEIIERSGLSNGAYWSRTLADRVRELDPTRPVTSGICGQWRRGEAGAPEDYLNYCYEKWYYPGGVYPDTKDEQLPRFRSLFEAYMKPLDIIGYNYLHRIYEDEHETYPDRVMWGSETWALTFYDSWEQVMKHPYVIGDFCWTCYDNLGENGAGRFVWERDGHIRDISITGFDWISCFQGDFDLSGHRRPQSYFREAIFKGPRAVAPRIFTTHPEHTGEGFSGTQWHFYDVHETWTFPDAYIGRPTKLDVYTTADRVLFSVNGRPVGEAVPEKAIASVTVPYEPGEVRATVYVGEEAVGEAVLRTHGEAADFVLTAEKTSIAADNRDLSYITVDVVDALGAPVPESTDEIRVSVTGGECLGVFSGDPKAQDPLTAPYCHAFEGHAVIVVRASLAGPITVAAAALGKTHTVTVCAEA